MPTATPEKARRIPPLQYVGTLPPSLLDVVTDRVREASEAHRERLAELARLKHEARLADEVAKEAARHDEAAAIEAVAAGKQPPKRTHPAALEDADAANRAVPAAAELARQSQFAYLCALAEDHDALVAAADAAIDALDAEGAQLCDAIESLLVRGRDVRLLRRELDHPVAPHARAQTFAVQPPTRRGPISPDQRAFLDGIRAAVAGA